MAEGKLYKTKLCVLYQRGHCPRQSCSFAHGSVELRRFGSFSGDTITVLYCVTHVVPCNGRRDYRGNDLRDKLDRRRSPQRRYSPRRDARGRHSFHGYSPSRSFDKKSDRKHRKKQHLDGQSDFSGSLKISDGTEDQVKERKSAFSDPKGALEEQLKQVQLDIDKLEDHKCQVQIYLEESVQEADSLASRTQELESQLYKEKEEYKRITSKIKKFMRAHNRHLSLQDELKRSQVRLQKLGDQLGSDITKLGTNEDDSSINIVSDGEATNNYLTGLRNELQKNASPNKKRPHINLEAAEEPKLAKLTEKGFIGATRIRKPSRWNVSNAQSNDDREVEVVNNGINGHLTRASEGKHRREKIVFSSIPSADKLKGLDSVLVWPTTGMAANAVDEFIDIIEAEEKVEVAETASERIEKEVAYEIPGVTFPLPPPPPVPKRAYSQFEGDDENVDVEGLEEEMVDVDIV